MPDSRSQASRLNHLLFEVVAIAPPQVAYSFVTKNRPTLHTFDRAGYVAGTRRATKSQSSRCSCLSENASIRVERFHNPSYPSAAWGLWRSGAIAVEAARRAPGFQAPIRHAVTVQVVTTGITPQLATSARLREAEKELLHPVRRLHTQWSGTPRRYAAVASTLPRPSSCFRQSASPPRSACQSSPCARARRDGSPSQPYYSSVQRLRPARTSTTPHAASACPDTSQRSGAHHIGCPLPITSRPLVAAGSWRTETSSVSACPRAPDATT